MNDDEHQGGQNHSKQYLSTLHPFDVKTFGVRNFSQSYNSQRMLSGNTSDWAPEAQALIRTNTVQRDDDPELQTVYS